MLMPESPRSFLRPAEFEPFEEDVDLLDSTSATSDRVHVESDGAGWLIVTDEHGRDVTARVTSRDFARLCRRAGV